MRIRDLWIATLGVMVAASCTTFRWTNDGFKGPSDLMNASTPLTDEEAGYDQAAYDECMDSPDTTPADCESI